MRGNKGLTLLELLVVLALSSILMAAMFGSFISQQKRYTIQDQVVETQQTLRASIDRMTREIRMAGYGGPVLETFGNVNSFTSLITSVNGSPLDSITILLADEVARLGQDAAAGSSQIALNVSSASDIFNTGNRKYLCLSGKDNYTVQKVSGNTVTLASPLKEDHLLNESVGLVKAITYRVIPNTTKLMRDENTGGGGEILAEDVEDLQIRYTLASGAVVDSPGNPEEIRMVSVRLTIRTRTPSRDFSGDGYLRRTMTSNIEVRNLGL
jgi:prepilin-type N-terminal cleavage/methylation domain-containing protein